MAQAKYQYSTSPRKVNPTFTQKNTKRQLRVVDDLPRQQVQISKEQRKKQLKLTAIVLVIFAVLMVISCRNSQIDKQFNNIQNQKKQLSVLQKENEQLKVSIENSLNLNNVENQAKDKLGMQKLTNKQTVYITLSKRDYVEAASEDVILEENKSWIDTILEKIFDKL